MRIGIPSSLGSALAWFAFPLVPTLLGVTHHQTLSGGADPWLWNWVWWVILTGPLVGYGFLAGATLDLPDDPSRRGPRGWLSRRSLWVAVGPWFGFLAWFAVVCAVDFAGWAYRPSREWKLPPLPESWPEWMGNVLSFGLVIVPLASGWLIVAWPALRRARRLGRLGRSLAKGLAMAIGFVGSLFGSFWAITESWREYFFDPRIAPVLVAVASLAIVSGCATTTVGEIRRRELFEAMVTAWLLGLALAWRWWARSKPGPRS